jgi:phosphoenolpyruvate-protein kinase (PTS system EI component)
MRSIEVEIGAPRACVGLFRTEFLFLRRQTAPTEAEQTAAYRRGSGWPTARASCC